MTMQLTFLFLIFDQINLTHAMLHGVISTSSYSVLLEKTIDQVYYGTTTISTHNNTTLTTVECAGICERAPGCGGFNFCHILGNRTCEAMTANEEPLDTTRDFRWTLGCFYFHKVLSPCLNGGIMVNSSCLCAAGYINVFCEDHVKDCVDVYHQGYLDKYTVLIQPNRDIDAFKVRCRTHEGPVTRILLRKQGELDFFDVYIPVKVYQYKQGMNYPWKNGNGWIGLDKLHSILINSRFNHTAKVTVIFHGDTTEYTGYYGNFFVDSGENSYTLTYTNFWAGENALQDGLSGSDQNVNDSANGKPFCPASYGSTCGLCPNSSVSGGWFGSGCYYVNPLTVLSELVWPNDSVLVPVDTLYIDIIANMP